MVTALSYVLLFNSIASLANTDTPYTLEFSPDGTKILTNSYPPQAMKELEIFDITTNSTITNPLLSGFRAKWFPDGKKVLFDNGTGAIVIDIERNEIILTKNFMKSPYVWRGEMGFVALQKERDEEMKIVWIAYPRGLVETSVEPPYGNISYFVYLPATDGVAFLDGMKNRKNVYIAAFNTVRQVTTTDDVISLASIEGGKKLVWARQSKNMRYILTTLWKYDVRILAVERLPFPERIPLINPNTRQAPSALEQISVSPDGSRVAIVARFTSAPEPPKQPRVRKKATPQKAVQKSWVALYTMNINGTNARLIRKIEPAKAWEGFLMTWSPDSSRIAVIERLTNLTSLFLYNADGSGKIKLKDWQKPKTPLIR
ncbi:MAG TPA: hypothetical protein VNK96_07675 [Fimbriimonadales bacterium]|nr:hypothetical protein [Fimbriimonadales bacterium]